MNDDFIHNLGWAALLALIGLAMCVAGSWADTGSRAPNPDSELPAYYHQPQPQSK